MLFATRLNEIASTVANYQTEIARLQQLISDHQQHAQQIQSAEQAAESALAQIETALSMIQAIAPDQIEIFKAAVDAKFSSEAIAELPVGVDEGEAEQTGHRVLSAEPEDEIETLEQLYADDTETTVDIEVTPITEVTVEVGETPEATNDNFLSYDELLKLKRPLLIKLAKGHTEKPHHQTAEELATVLTKVGVSQTDALVTSLKK